jgi:fused signal recognition particle receptor
LKVTLGYRDGFVGEGQISYAGPGARARGELALSILRHRLGVAGLNGLEHRAELLGVNAMHGPQSGAGHEPYEVRVRLAVRCATRAQAERVGQEVEALYLNGPAGGGGATQSVREVVAAASALMPRGAVQAHCHVFEHRFAQGAGEAGGMATATPANAGLTAATPAPAAPSNTHATPASACASASPPTRLQDIAIARSGDKGNRATLSVIARDPAHYPLMAQLLTADIGVTATRDIIEHLTESLERHELADIDVVKDRLRTYLHEMIAPVSMPLVIPDETRPFVILVVGVNGVGKTTTIGKLAKRLQNQGHSVMLAAGDTFRAAAIEQLNVWGQRISATVMSRPTGADASGLAFDAIAAAKEEGADILFIDTAGRLQNKQYLMDELDKIVRVIKKQDETAPHAVLLVLDATTGQNAMAQAEIFTKVAGVTGLIMTKLDGTARGGILVAIAEKFAIPIHAIGVGEAIEDLQPFDADGFARAIAGLEET